MKPEKSAGIANLFGKDWLHKRADPKPATERPAAPPPAQPCIATEKSAAQTSWPSWSLNYLYASGSTEQQIPTATVKLKKGVNIVLSASIGAGPTDAIIKTINRLTETSGKLMSCSLQLTRQGEETLFKFLISVGFDDADAVVGEGSDADILKAFALSYLDAINQFLYNKTAGELKKRRRDCLPA